MAYLCLVVSSDTLKIYMLAKVVRWHENISIIIVIMFAYYIIPISRYISNVYITDVQHYTEILIMPMTMVYNDERPDVIYTKPIYEFPSNSIEVIQTI